MGNIKEKEIMPKDRIYTLRGKLDATSTVHEQLPLLFKTANYLYEVIDFKVYPDDVNSPDIVTGTLTRSQADTTDPTDLSIADNNVVAWAQAIRYQAVPPPAGEVLQGVSYDSFVDAEQTFGTDLWVHLASVARTNVNYYIVLRRVKVSNAGAVADDIEQYQINTNA
jgi:hypothetical protein